MPSSYFTDEFQLSDGRTYAIGEGATVSAATLAADTAGNQWLRMLLSSVTEKGTVTATTLSGAGVPGIVWPIPFDNPAITATVTGALAVNDEIGLWVSIPSNSAQFNGYAAIWKVTEANKANFQIYRVINNIFAPLTGEAAVTLKIGDVLQFRNEEGGLFAYRNGVSVNGINNYGLGAGLVGISMSAKGVTLTNIFKGSGDNGVKVGRAQVIKYKEEINFANKEGGGLEGAYAMPPCFLSYGPQITPPVGTVLSLEEVRAEVTPVSYGASLNGLVSQAEVQAFGNQIDLVLGPVFLVIIRDPFQYLNQAAGQTNPPYEWPKGMYLPGFHGVGVIERLEIIPERKLSLEFSSHEATIKFGLVEDPIQPATVNKVFNPAVNISGGRVLGFGVESTPSRQPNASTPWIAQRYQHYLEVRAAARYRIFELGERSS
jgi:hypothetical protein